MPVFATPVPPLAPGIIPDTDVAVVAVLALPVRLPVNVVDVTDNKPARLVDVPFRGIEVVPIVVVPPSVIDAVLALVIRPLLSTLSTGISVVLP